MKTLKINVTSFERIPWARLKTFQFNQLKNNNERNISKLKKSIKNKGFNFPFYVWAGNDFCIDGTGRFFALMELESEGFLIPDIPIVEIFAKDLKEAKKRVLEVSSQHGLVSQESFDSFVMDIDLTDMVDEIEFPGIDIFGDNEPLDPEDENTKKTGNGFGVSVNCKSEEEEEQVSELLEGYGYSVRRFSQG
ncbi:MAG: ParB N-terminal domain-containing protein [Smithella sp.]